MPAHRKRPLPPERMVELLAESKRRLLREQGYVSVGDFEREWERAWALMVTERAWPHATVHRRAWRTAMLDCKPETRACFLNVPSPFQLFAQACLAEPEPEPSYEETLLGLMVA